MNDRKISFRLENQVSAKSRLFWIFAFLLILIAAAIPRLIELGRSLWAGESWVANSILADSLHHMFFYDTWLQTTPPLFLFLARMVVKLLGASNYTLRLLPFLFGMAAVVITACLALRFFRFPAAILCMILVAMAPTAIRYSLELKQYTGDMAFTSAILLALWLYLEENHRAYGWIIALFAGGIFLSHTSVMFVPLAACVLLFGRPDLPQTARIRRCVLFLILAGVLGGLQYFYFAKPNIVSNLKTFWDQGFLHSFRPGVVALFYMKYFVGSGICFFLPNQSNDFLEMALGVLPGPVRLILFLSYWQSCLFS